MTFDVTAHPLLSATAVALLSADLGAFGAQADAAEIVLQLTAGDLGIAVETDLDAGLRAKARLAVVRQINYDLANPPEQNGLSMERRGERQVQYFAGRYDPARAVDSQAKMLADAVRLAVLGDPSAVAASDDDEWAVVRSPR